MPNEKSKARKDCQSFHTKQFVQPAELEIRDYFIFGIDIMKPSSQENIFHCVLCNLLFVETCCILKMCLECSVNQYSFTHNLLAALWVSTFTASLPHVCFSQHHIQTREEGLAAFQKTCSIKTYFA